eukprot:m51a1_g1404 hypothetical protein (1028) ;mRNA; r:502213-505964
MGFLGTPIAQLRAPDSDIPPFIDSITLFVLRHGLGDEGIFRLSPNKAVLQGLIEEIDKAGNELDFTVRRPNVHVACSALKSFFHSLDECVLTSALYEAWLRVLDCAPSEILARLKELVGKLPDDNRAVLERIVRMLVQVALNEDRTRMDAKARAAKFPGTACNLGVVWAPSLLWIRSPADDPMAALQRVMESTSAAAVVAELVSNHDVIFPSSPRGLLPVLAAKRVASTKPIAGIAVSTERDGGYALWSLDSAGGLCAFNLHSLSRIETFHSDQERPLRLLTVGNSVWATSASCIAVFVRGSREPERILTGFWYTVCTVNYTVWTSGEEGLRVWDRNKLECVRDIRQPPGVVTMAMKFTGSNVWCGGSDGVLRVYSGRTGRLVAENTTPFGKIFCMAALAGQIVTGHEDGSMCVWDPRTFEMQSRVQAPGNAPGAGSVFCVEPVGTTLWSCLSNGRVLVWNASDWSYIGALPDVHCGAVSSTLKIFNTKEKRWQVWLSSWDGSISVWDIDAVAIGLEGGSRAPKSQHVQDYSMQKLGKPGILECANLLDLASETCEVIMTMSPRMSAKMESELSDVLPPKDTTSSLSVEQAIPVAEEPPPEELLAITKETDIAEVVEAAYLFTKTPKDKLSDTQEWLSSKRLTTCGDVVESGSTMFKELEVIAGKPVAKAIRRALRHLKSSKAKKRRSKSRKHSDITLADILRFENMRIGGDNEERLFTSFSDESLPKSRVPPYTRPKSSGSGPGSPAPADKERKEHRKEKEDDSSLLSVKSTGRKKHRARSCSEEPRPEEPPSRLFPLPTSPSLEDNSPRSAASAEDSSSAHSKALSDSCEDKGVKAAEPATPSERKSRRRSTKKDKDAASSSGGATSTTTRRRELMEQRRRVRSASVDGACASSDNARGNPLLDLPPAITRSPGESADASASNAPEHGCCLTPLSSRGAEAAEAARAARPVTMYSVLPAGARTSREVDLLIPVPQPPPSLPQGLPADMENPQRLGPQTTGHRAGKLFSWSLFRRKSSPALPPPPQ